VSSQNEYWNSQAGKTYNELYDYYRPPEFYNEKGYTSPYYKETYYDGYGQNFYYGNYGYYEYSRPPALPKLVPFELTEFLKVFAGMVFALVLYSYLYYKLLMKEKKKKSNWISRIVNWHFFYLPLNLYYSFVISIHACKQQRM